MEITILKFSLSQVEYLIEDGPTTCVVKQDLVLKSLLTFIEESGLNLMPFDNGSNASEIALKPADVLEENTFDIIKRYLTFYLF